MRKLNKYHLSDFFHVDMIRKHLNIKEEGENDDIEGALGDQSPK